MIRVTSTVLLLAAQVQAVYGSVTSADAEKMQVLAVAKKYAEATTCNSTLETNATKKTSLNEVFLVGQEDFGFRRYYVWWQGQVRCYSGKAMYQHYLTQIERGNADKPFVVITDNLLKNIIFYKPKYNYFLEDNDFGKGDVEFNVTSIESIKMINPLKFEVIGWDYADLKFGGEDRGPDFTPNQFKYILTRKSQVDSEWTLVHQTLLQQVSPSSP